jgi:hypothetical protein
MTTRRYLQTEEDEVVYKFDWRPWLTQGDSIASYGVTAEQGLTIDQVSEAAGLVSYMVSGGEDGHNYRVACRITTASGMVVERCITMMVRGCPIL